MLEKKIQDSFWIRRLSGKQKLTNFEQLCWWMEQETGATQSNNYRKK